MNATAQPAVHVLLPDDDTRRRNFYWLKRNSSYTAWQRIFSFYKRWANVTEASLREASNRGWDKLTGIPESDYVLILKCLAHCEEGVLALQRGDKRVFCHDANGEFVMAYRMLSYWCEMEYRIDIGENSIDEAHTPYWDDFRQALDDLAKAWSECSLTTLQTRYLEDPAPNVYGEWQINLFKQFPFPASLPELPPVAEEVLVYTGKPIPFSGIWEPVDAPAPKRWSLMRDDTAKRGPYAVAGCMNYLHGGADAPLAILEHTSHDDDDEVKVTWRLLWKDDRYIDGSIPPEEKDYVFQEPRAATARTPLVQVTDDQIIWAKSGARAPASGRWLLETDVSVVITVQAGDVLPLHAGREVRWVLAST